MSALKHAVLNDKESILVSGDTVRLIQNRLLLVLDDVISICEEHDIPYMLGGGSALGAVRHHGFIPWDDDIDINMCRKDAVKFLPLFRERFNDKYWIISPGEPENTYMMIHILTKDVRARGIMQPESDEWGLCLDIFIIENTFNRNIVRKVHGYACMGFRYILSCLRFKRNKSELEILSEKDGELSGYIRKRLKISSLLSVIPLSKWSALSDKCMALCRNDQSVLVSIPAGQKQYFGEMYNREKYCELITVDFEGRKVSISKDYDAYLRKLYGDYMRIPPKEKREKHVMRELDLEALQKYKDVVRK